MMDCKKALEEAENNFDQAIEILRKKGQKVAAKRQDREANEGVVIAKASSDNKSGVLLTLNCETDFVAKNEDFVKFARELADRSLEALPGSVEELKELKFSGEVTVEEKINEEVGKIGEKIAVDTVEFIQAETVVGYEHPGNKIGTLVGLNKAGKEVVEIGKEVAMQVAAMNPVSVDENDVPEEIVQRELELGKEQAQEEGKPDHIVDKIAQGKLKKFYQENTLLNQPFTRDNNKTVKTYLQETDQDLTVTEFKRYSLV